jgi:glutaredoxin 3
MRVVTLYTTDQCARCVTAKTLLSRRGIGYEEINLAKDPDGRAELARRTGMVTFPQIVIGEETLGGLDELVVADREGRLGALLAASAGSATDVTERRSASV